MSKQVATTSWGVENNQAPKTLISSRPTYQLVVLPHCLLDNSHSSEPTVRTITRSFKLGIPPVSWQDTNKTWSNHDELWLCRLINAAGAHIWLNFEGGITKTEYQFTLNWFSWNWLGRARIPFSHRTCWLKRALKNQLLLALSSRYPIVAFQF